jgi:hypothetical protein
MPNLKICLDTILGSHINVLCWFKGAIDLGA